MLLTSCTSGPQYIIDCDRITGIRSHQLCKEEDLTIFCTGGAMMTSIKEISVCFDKKDKVDLSEARRLCVKCLEELRSVVNQTESLHPHLTPFPFPVSGMEISIIFTKKNYEFIDYGPVDLGQGGISSVMQIKNNLYYMSFNRVTQKMEDFYEEPYEEALRIVNEEYGYCY